MEVLIDNELEVVATGSQSVGVTNNIEVTSELSSDLTVTADRREFTVVDDAVFPRLYEDAPKWMRDLLDNTMETAIAISKQDINTATLSLNSIISELDVAKNAYEVSIVSNSTVDSKITAAVTTLNSEMMGNNGTVVNLVATKATPDEASALSLTAIESSLNNGLIAAKNNEIATTAADANGVNAAKINTLENTYVGFGNTISGLTTAYSTLVTDVNSNRSSVESKYGYTSSLTLNGNNYITGFDLTSSMTDVGGNSDTRSRFIISADEFQLVNPVQTGSKTEEAALLPTFSVDSSTGRATFNGVVEFNSIPDVPEFALGSELARDIASLQGQIDGSITTWFKSGEPTLLVEPASLWTTTSLKNSHLGDLYYNNSTGYAYRFAYEDITIDGIVNPVYLWLKITDTDITLALANASTAQDTADGKRKVFVAKPKLTAADYDIGDLWIIEAGYIPPLVPAVTVGDIVRCQVKKTVAQAYADSDWIIASKYTDDTVVDSVISGGTSINLANATVDGDLLDVYLANETDANVVLYSGTVAPINGEVRYSENDIYIFNTTSMSTGGRVVSVIETYQYLANNTWSQINNNSELINLVDSSDGKRTIWDDDTGTLWTFTDSFGNTPKIGDLLLSGSNNVPYLALQDNPLVETHWEIKRDTTNDSNLATALSDIANLEETNDGIVTTFYRSINIPTTMTYGDWYVDDTIVPIVDVYRYEDTNGKSLLSLNWVKKTTDAIAVALMNGSNAQYTADGKVQTYYTTIENEPTLVANDIGDMWVQTNSVPVNYTQIWNGASWDPTFIESFLIDNNTKLNLSEAVIDTGSGTKTFIEHLAVQIADKAIVIYSGNDNTLQVVAKDGDLYLETKTETRTGGSIVDVLRTFEYQTSDWVEISSNANITALADKTDDKRTIYGNASGDVPSGDENDIWIPTTGSDDATYPPQELHQSIGGLWEVTTKYTEELGSFKTLVDNNISSLQSQVDGQVDYYFYDDVGVYGEELLLLANTSSTWTTDELKLEHQGDVGYFRDTSHGYYYNRLLLPIPGWDPLLNSGVVESLANASEAKSTADGKIKTYYDAGGLTDNSVTETKGIGDLWINIATDLTNRWAKTSSNPDVFGWETFDAAKAANNSVTEIDGGKIEALSITTRELAADSITTDKIVAGVVLVDGVVQDTAFRDAPIPYESNGFQLKANAAGTVSDPNIYGATILGSNLVSSKNYERFLFPAKPTENFYGVSDEIVLSVSHNISPGDGSPTISITTKVIELYNPKDARATSNSLDAHLINGDIITINSNASSYPHDFVENALKIKAYVSHVYPMSFDSSAIGAILVSTDGSAGITTSFDNGAVIPYNVASFSSNHSEYADWSNSGFMTVTNISRCRVTLEIEFDSSLGDRCDGLLLITLRTFQSKNYLNT